MSTQPSADAPLVHGRLWTVDETAAYLGVPIATMYRWRHHGSGPRAYRVGRYLRYDPAEVQRWLRAGSP